MSRPAILPERIVMMEDHDKAYHAWKQRGVRQRVLVHVDAHIDFGWVPEIDLEEIGPGVFDPGKASKDDLLLNPFLKSRKKMVNIGNYIFPAIKEGMVKKFYWVVPRMSWRSARGKKYIIRQLKQLLKIKKYSGGRLALSADSLSCRIMGIEVIVCSLEGLKRIEEPVLLDIDVDFMLTERIWDDLNPQRRPWVFPQELFEMICRKISNIDILTVAYSVEGGFTPLKFKYLGDELRLLFEGGLCAHALKMMQHKRKACGFEKEKKRADAVKAYEEILSFDTSDASVYFNLALLYMDMDVKEAEKAAHFYNEAVSRDSSYAGVYNNYGILYLRYNRLKAAQREYKKFLKLSQDNPDALNGLGHISLTQRRFTAAGEFFDRCLAFRRDHPEARLGKGIVNFKQGRLAEAEELFAGFKNDYPDEPESYWWLGCIAQKKGEVPSAIDYYKHAVMRGGEGPLVHLKLARHYLSMSFYFRAFEELKRFFVSWRIFS
jgi:Tfp pilus assembly protein PilF